jgi:hypothetical protein
VPANHRLAPDGVEQGSEQERPGEVADREGGDVPANGVGAHAVELVQHERVGEEDGVVDEGLADEQREPQHRASRVELEDGLREREEADRAALADLDGAVHRLELRPCVLLHLALDRGHERLGLLVAPVDEQPARRLRHVAAHEDDPEASTAPRPKATRQPTPRAKTPSSSSTSESSAPNAVPSQNEPLMMRSTVPRTRAGISSSRRS